MVVNFLAICSIVPSHGAPRPRLRTRLYAVLRLDNKSAHYIQLLQLSAPQHTLLDQRISLFHYFLDIVGENTS